MKEKMNDQYEEKVLKATNGMPALILNILLSLAAIAAIIIGGVMMDTPESSFVLGVILLVVGTVWLCIPMPLLIMGLKVLKPKEALVLTLFGRYYGTLFGDGFYFVNPFVTAVNPAFGSTQSTTEQTAPTITLKTGLKDVNMDIGRKKLSLKAMTLANEKQKINDAMGNPIIIGIVVIWQISNTAKAVFNVDNFKEFLSIQCDSALRNIVRLYPYDSFGTEHEKTLRGSSVEIAEKLREEIQEKVEIAGLEIREARITHLSYAQEIAAVMLQRQQASAIVDARQMIVDGAVGMVQMALDRLNEDQIVHLDEERKAAMVSNLLVVLCGNKDAQPIVNSGSLY